VIKGQKARVAACGYCHLPDGSGRPENARLAGLNAEYIVQQVLDMKSGARNGAGPANFPPSVNMRAVADSVSLEDLRAAARYFSQLKPHRRSRVVETTKIPRVEPLLGVYAKSETRDSEPLGHRLIEAAQDAKRHELRDPRTAYVAYVPPGSIKAGQRLATQGRADGLKSCVSCHGPQLRGVGPVPRIAGQPPSYILRQLVAFKVGSRATEQGELMQDVASRLSLDDMIAVAAYAGSRLP
jgi:cytochrome c553